MNISGVEGQQVILLLEDHQILEPSFLEMINSLLSAGEVPGLYTTEELESLLVPLKDTLSEEGYHGTLVSYFSSRVRLNLHVVLIMDSSSSQFITQCEANPALYTACSFQSMEGWSGATMLQLPMAVLNKTSKNLIEQKQEESEFSQMFVDIHKSCSPIPRQFVSFLNTYSTVYSQKKDGLLKQQERFQAGVSKLNEATTRVDELKVKAAEQQLLLTQKQAEADEALQEITASMQAASEQKTEMEKIRQQQNEERAKLEKRKKAIDIELSDVEPLVAEAKKAVGNIKPETLAEIRALRMPPSVIKDILEGVLSIMGVYDTSWGNMRSFLAKKELREDIQSFDARKISPDVRNTVQELLEKNKKSFEPAVAKRASVAAAPLAVWVKANIQYSVVLEKIGPLEKEKSMLQGNLDKSEAKLAKLGNALKVLDQRVSDMKLRFEQRTTEAARLRMEVEREEEIILAAENLVGKLKGEHKRWSEQVKNLNRDMERLPTQSILAAAFLVYLCKSPEDERASKLEQWKAIVGLEEFELRRFLSTEKEQLSWKGEGLPGDDLSIENALIILQGQSCPLLIDPSQRATTWLKTHLKDARLEVINQQDSNFSTSLELAVRFGKTLVIQEVDGVEPLIVPLLRKDLVSQGHRHVVQIGDKPVDYNDTFRLFLTTRNPDSEIPPYNSALISEVNFTTTRAGLCSQLLGATIQHEKPELEDRKTELLKMEEDQKIQLAGLEESLLQELASAQGNILENKTLLDSLNEMKAKSLTITESLEESVKLQVSLNQERNAFLPVAEFGSKLFFVIESLSKLNHMYQFSLGSFLRLFKRVLQNSENTGDTDLRIQSLKTVLQLLAYQYVCRSLFKADCLMFALHLVHGIKPELFNSKEWEVFTGSLVEGVFRRQESIKQMKESLPSWCDPGQSTAINLLKNTFPNLFSVLDLTNTALWTQFSQSSQCEKDFPPSIAKRITPFQQLLAIQALQPDHLQSAMEQFASYALGLKELSPSTLNLKKLYATETSPSEPILLILSGADPSQELQELAYEIISVDNYEQLAMGQGQADIALQLLHDCAGSGKWLCLKNVHLVIPWLSVLEKELNGLEPNENFRLWLTTEPHVRFPPILLQNSLKVTYEAPPGIKRNLQRTYESWSEEYVEDGQSTSRAQTLFVIAWFHAVVQERRVHIPQGWSKYYEFSMSDLRAATNLIDRLSANGSEYHTVLYVCTCTVSLLACVIFYQNFHVKFYTH